MPDGRFGEAGLLQQVTVKARRGDVAVDLVVAAPHPVQHRLGRGQNAFGPAALHAALFHTGGKVPLQAVLTDAVRRQAGVVGAHADQVVLGEHHRNPGGLRRVHHREGDLPMHQIQVDHIRLFRGQQGGKLLLGLVGIQQLQAAFQLGRRPLRTIILHICYKILRLLTGQIFFAFHCKKDHLMPGPA